MEIEGSLWLTLAQEPRKRLEHTWVREEEGVTVWQEWGGGIDGRMEGYFPSVDKERTNSSRLLFF